VRLKAGSTPVEKPGRGAPPKGSNGKLEQLAPYQ